MLRGFRWFALAAVLAIGALIGPTAALADGCNDGSATSIYSECVPTADGGKTHKHPPSKPAPSTQPTQPTYPYPTQPVQPVVQPHVSSRTKHALNRSGKDRELLKNLIADPRYAETRRLTKTVLASSPTGASLGSAFDLGAGPMILFALLAGTVLLLLGTGGVRSWRNRHRV